MIALLVLSAFLHKPHVETAKLVCLDCHTAPARFGGEVGYPVVAKCAVCHGDREKERVIPSQHAVKLPDFVYFDHRMHLINTVKCEDCHGPDAAEQPTTMKFCQSCHVRTHAAATCSTCHDPR